MVTQEVFGLLDGRKIPLLTLTDGPVSVELIPLGAAVRAIRVPDREGRTVDVCLGYDTPAEYRDWNSALGGTLGQPHRRRPVYHRRRGVPPHRQRGGQHPPRRGGGLSQEAVELCPEGGLRHLLPELPPRGGGVSRESLRGGDLHPAPQYADHGIPGLL